MSGQRWGCHLIVSKDMAADPEVDLDGFLKSQFNRTLEPGMSVMGYIEWEWTDVDDSPFNVGQLLEDGTEIPPIENAWFVRGTAVVA